MEDYMRGILCGYLTVQRGVKDDAKKTRMFLVLTDSRMDYYATDPLPEFEQDIADAYIFTPATRVHFYVEINAKAPPFSLCLTADKATHVHIADSDEDAQTWYRHLHERQDALTTMVTGTLVLRKEISVNQQLTRMLLKTKYKWKSRYIELGRSSLRFCKESDRKTKMMKQFTLSAQSFVSEEGSNSSSSTGCSPPGRQDAQPLQKGDARAAVHQQFAAANAHQVHVERRGGVSVRGRDGSGASVPGRADWVVAIKMRIISLKCRHNGDKKDKAKDADLSLQLRGFMEVQMKPDYLQGSVLVAISQFEMAHESFENIWHKLRHKKGYQHPMTLTFRVPAMKQGVAAVRMRVRDPWVLCRCTLQHGKLSVASMDKKKSSETNNQTHTILADLPLRHCQVELVGEEDCPNGIKITVTGTSSSALATTLLLNVADDHDCFLWFALLHLETAITQDDFRCPLSIATLVNSKNPPKRSSFHLTGVAEDQRRCFQPCSVVGMRIDEIEKAALVKDPMARLQASGNGDLTGGINLGAVHIVIGSGSTSASRQLSESDSKAFFQHLDAIGCGKITSTGLVRTMEALTRHIERQETPEIVAVGPGNSGEDKPAGGHGVLSAFYAALDALGDASDKKENGSFSISMSELLALMKSVTDAEVVDLVQKMTRHDIQCM